MDKWVDEWGKSSISIGNEFQSNITCNGHKAVVSHMEEGNLIVFLAEDEEESIQKVDKF